MESSAKVVKLEYGESPNSEVGWYILDAGNIVSYGLTHDQARAICEWINARKWEIAE